MEIKKTKYARQIAIMIVFLMLFGNMTACKKNFDTPEINAQTREIVEPLFEASLAMDKILYGEGLSVSEEGKDGKYSKVTDEKYKCVEDIRIACAEIYTSGQCQMIENYVLTGRGTELGKNIYARYIDLEGQLYKHDAFEVKENLAERYDFDSIKTVDKTDKRIIFTVDRYVKDSDTPMNVEFTLLWSASSEKWQLDSPTY